MHQVLLLCCWLVSLLPTSSTNRGGPPTQTARKLPSQSRKHLMETHIRAITSPCDITRFGAIAGNNTADAPANAVALRTALARCQRVIIPSGKVFKITPVVIPSNRILELQEGKLVSFPFQPRGQHKSKQTNKQASKQTNKQASKQTNKQTNKKYVRRNRHWDQSYVIKSAP